MKKRLLSLLLAMVMVLILSLPSLAAGTTQLELADLTGAIVILHTNDVHGAIDGYSKVAALKQDYESRGAYVLLMDAGDFIQGDPTVNLFQGTTAIELMNMAGYDVATLGNHEFDYGYANLTQLLQSTGFAVLSSNILYGETLAFGDHMVFTAPDGSKIGVFGLTTPETATKAHPGKIAGVSFLSGQALIDCAQKQVDALKNLGCSYVICLAHLGIDDESVGHRSIDLVNSVTGIDILIDGHSHSTLEEIQSATGGAGMVGDTLLTSTGTKLANVGVISIMNDGIVCANLPIDQLTVDPVSGIAARAAAIRQEVEDEYGAVFAKTEVVLNGARDPGNRTQETNLGNLIADALLWGAQSAGTDVDAAITNGGGIRASIPTGGITKKDINTVLPFGNTLSIVEVTGSELLEALEASTYSTPTAIGGFPQVSGIAFTVDTTKPYDQGSLYPDSTYYAPNSIQRVTIQSVGGQPFDPAATYTIATNDFMASGGDTYYAFKAATINYDLGTPMDEVVMDYVTQVLGGTVPASRYGTTEGRIIVTYNDVTTTAWYYDAVKYVTLAGIMNGIGGNSFSPTANVTRGTLFTMLARYDGQDTTGGSAWYERGVTWAVAEGISDGTAVHRDITRAEIVTILWRYMDKPQAGYDLSSYADANAIPGWDGFEEAMGWAVSSGILQGDNQGLLRPTDTASRMEIAQIMMNFCENVAA